MVSMKLLMIMLVSPCVTAERQWPFSLWRNDKEKKVTKVKEYKSSMVELTSKTKSKASKEAAMVELNGGKALSKVPTPSFYHTTSQISTALATMSCAGMSYERVADPGEKKGDTLWKEEGVELDVVRFAPVDANEEVNKVMLVAGEHAREMISAETAFGVVQELCKGNDFVQKARKNTEYLIVVNANPRSRALVEAGAHCLRTNPNGVDTNRNWDDNFDSQHEESNPDTNPGSHAFSEPESRITKKLMEDFKPDTFLDVHSGTLGLYLPNGLLKEHRYTKRVESVLQEINNENCKCPLGIANVEVGYQTSGSSLDYAYDKVGSKFVMAMEVWAKPEQMQRLRSRWEDQKKELVQEPSFLETVPQSKYNFKQSEEMLEQEVKGMSSQDCFGFFNPDDEAMYQKTVSKWTTTLLELSITGNDIPKSKSQAKKTSMMQKPEEQASPMGHILRVGAVVLLMVGLWFLWQRFSHLITKNKAAEASPLAAAAQMGPIQVSD